MNNKNSGLKPSNNTKAIQKKNVADKVCQNTPIQGLTGQRGAEQDVTHQESRAANAQRQKARRLLAVLQWTTFTILLIGLIWLYVMQQRQYTEIMQRVQRSVQLTERINILEDKLIAATQTADAKNNDNIAKIDDVSSQSTAQLEQIRLQIQAANLLSNNGQIPAAIQLLQGVHWQLEQKNNQIVPALTLVLNKSLDKDIAMLENISSQPDGWQVHALTIQTVQKFLYATMHNSIKGSAETQAEVNTNNSAAKTILTPSLQKAIISPQDAIIYDVLMQLNLAQQAANNKDGAMLKLYLTQAIERLSLIERTTLRAENAQHNNAKSNNVENTNHDSSKNKQISKNSKVAQNGSNQNTESSSQQSHTSKRVHTLTNISDAIKLLQQLDQQPPKPIMLTTTQIVVAPENVVIQ